MGCWVLAHVGERLASGRAGGAPRAGVAAGEAGPAQQSVSWGACVIVACVRAGGAALQGSLVRDTTYLVNGGQVGSRDIFTVGWVVGWVMGGAHGPVLGAG